MRSRIQINTGESLGLSDEIAYSLNFAIADIREPDKRNANYSKTITIPAGKVADRFFKAAFEIDGYDNYNPNLKTEATILIDDIPQVRGYMQLLSITREDRKYMYNINIKGNVTNIFQVWAEQMLTDLDLSAFDHIYNKVTQKSSWTAPTGSGYVYPMIDHGFTNGLTYDVNHFFPAVYVKQYIDLAFEIAGFTYNSAFFNSAFFNSLIIPYNSTTLKLSDAEIALRYFKAELSATQTFDLNSASQFQWTIGLDTIISDVSGQFNVVAHKFTAADTGDYQFTSNVDFDLSWSGMPASPHNTETFSFYIEVYNVTKAQIIGITPYIIPAMVATNGGTSIAYNAVATTQTVRVSAGDEVILFVRMFSSGQPYFQGYPHGAGGTFNMNINNATLENKIINTGLFDGNALLMNNAIPQKIKIKDFVKWIVQMFNLYIQPDNDIPNKLNIEPRNDFYAAGTTVDWTSKLDTGRVLEITPMGDLNAVEYDFMYKTDKDYFNTKYSDSYQEVFGTEKKIIENDFIKDISKNEIGFSPTPSTTIGTTDRIIPQIVALNSSGAITQMPGYNIRILYYGGVKSTYNAWAYTSLISGTSTETTYPYCGMTDNPTAPTFDLSFGVPREVYYITSAYTNNCLYNAYYKKFIEEITDKDSKVVTADLHLTPLDIYTLDFRNQFFIDRHFLRLNKIFDYNFVSNELTKCEFIKIKEAAPFVADTGVTVGGSDAFFNDGSFTPRSTIASIPATFFGNIISGNNTVDSTARGCIVSGDGNYIGAGCTNISILGSNNCRVLPDVHNVVINNSFDFTAEQSNLAVINSAVSYRATYKANIEQNTMNNPNVQVLQNTFSGPIVWTRFAAGIYIGTLIGAFVGGNTNIYLQLSPYAGGVYTIEVTSDDTIQISTSDGVTLQDDLLFYNSLEITRFT